MPVSFPHGFGLVPHVLVDHALIYTSGGQIACKAMAIGVKADFEPVTAKVPVRPSHGLPKAAVGHIGGQRRK